MRTKIQNSDDLRFEILRLKALSFEIENDLKTEGNRITKRLQVPIVLLNRMFNWINPNKNKQEEELDQDWVSTIFKVGLPLLMNRFIFPKSGLLLKYVVELVSQNTGKTFNKEVILNLINKLSGWIKSGKQRKNEDLSIHQYGIPPDSETY